MSLEISEGESIIPSTYGIINKVEINCAFCSKSFQRDFRVTIKSFQKSENSPFKLRCPKCTKGLDNERGVKLHLAKSHKNEEPRALQCRYCFEVFKNKSTFKGHLEEHEESFKCVDCVKESERPPKLEVQLGFPFNIKDDFNCKICCKEFTTERLLRIHLRSHYKRCSYTCTDCHSTYNSKIFLLRHLKSHPKFDVLSYTCKCLLCDWTVTNLVEFNFHLNSEDHLKSENDYYEKAPKDRPTLLVLMNQNLLKTGNSTTVKHPEETNDEMSTETDGEKEYSTVNDFPLCEDLKSEFEESEILSSFDTVNYPTLDADEEMLFIPSKGSNLTKCSNETNSSQHLKELKVHSSKSENSRQFNCSQCEKSFEFRYQLQRHFLKSHGPKNTVKCHICSKEFSAQTRFASIQRHTENHYKDSKFKCEDCNITYRCKRTLMIHLNLNHPAKKSYSCQCLLCELKFPDVDQLNVHLNSAEHLDKENFSRVANVPSDQTHSELNKRKNEDISSCTELSVPTRANRNPTKKSKSELEIAISEFVEISEGVTIMTDSKEKGAREKKGKTVKQTKRQKKKMNRCGICNKPFANEECLNAHMTIHTEAKPLKCLICPEIFDQPDLLQRHLSKIHSTSSSFLCKFCKKSFSLIEDAMHHVSKIHIQDRAYRCNEYECKDKKYFKLKAGLLLHLLNHKERQFTCKCNFCCSAMNDLDDFELHMTRCRFENPLNPAKFISVVQE